MKKTTGLPDGSSVKSCPKCGRRAGTTEARPVPDGWRRRYECKYCNVRWSTMEMLVVRRIAGKRDLMSMAIVRERARAIAQMRLALDALEADDSTPHEESVVRDR